LTNQLFYSTECRFRAAFAIAAEAVNRDLAARDFAAIHSSDPEKFLIHGGADRIGIRAIRKGGLFK
jgi:hypothetical protein